MVDSCVVLDVFTRDPKWFAWSSRALEEAANAGPIWLNAVVYAEISVRFSRIEELDALLPQDVFELLPIPRAAAFLAAKCHTAYRKRGGSKATTLPDLFIGAHAAVMGAPLITRDPRRFRAHFPTLRLLCP